LNGKIHGHLGYPGDNNKIFPKLADSVLSSISLIKTFLSRHPDSKYAVQWIAQIKLYAQDKPSLMKKLVDIESRPALTNSTTLPVQTPAPPPRVTVFVRSDLDPVRDLFRLIKGTPDGKGPGGVYGKLECSVCKIGQREESHNSSRGFHVYIFRI
jgi:hypothetical protein